MFGHHSNFYRFNVFLKKEQTLNINQYGNSIVTKKRSLAAKEERASKEAKKDLDIT
jgi:hypothetical protein